MNRERCQYFTTENPFNHPSNKGALSTNPPYLAKNSATRLKMDIDFSRHRCIRKNGDFRCLLSLDKEKNDPHFDV